MDLYMPKILVTGANGFIGTALCDSLRLQGVDVVAAVRAKAHQNEYQVGNFSATMDWLPVLDGCETIIHLAARAHVLRDGSTDPLAAFRAMNVDTTLNLARQAALSGIKRFIFISSIGVNGAETFSQPFSELSVPEPHSNYALSKFEAEEGLKDICLNSGMEFVIIRPPLVYGHQAPGHFKTLLRIASKGLPLPFKLVKNKRSIICLENLVDFIKACTNNEAAANQIFLVSDGMDVSTSLLIELLRKGMEKKSNLFSIPMPILDFGARLIGKCDLYTQLCCSLQIDMAKARNLLEWVPPINVVDGIRQAGQRYLNEKTF
jgi:nucleoside-diphosphate-sugar epimerase